MSPVLIFVADRLTAPTPLEVTQLRIPMVSDRLVWYPAFASPLDGSHGMVGVFGETKSLPDVMAEGLKWYQGVGYQFACDPATAFGKCLIQKIESEEI